MSGRPTVQMLIELLYDLVQWELFASQLRDFDEVEIQKIQRESRLIDQQKLSLYTRWLEMCPDASWLDVVTALERGKKKTIAEKVKEKMQITTCTPDDAVRVKLEENEEKKIEDKLEKLHESFTLLLHDVRKEIENKTKKQLREITKNISDANIDVLDDLAKCTTVDEITNILPKKCSFLDGSVLHYFVKLGLPESKTKSALLVRTEKHMKEAQDFICKEPLRSLKGKLHDEKGDVHSHLIIKVNERWNNVKISLVKKLLQRLADNDDLSVSIIKVKDGCIEITFFISENQLKIFQVLTKQKEHFIRLVGVFYLHVGRNPPLFQEDENKSYTFENGLLEAAKMGHVQAIGFTSNIEIIDVDYKNDEGKTALILASEHGHSEAVKLILSAGASVDIQDSNGQTAIMVAKTVDIYQTLVQAKANTNIVTHKGSTPLLISCLHGNHDVANYQLFTLKHNITTRPDGLTLLMAASYGGNNQIVEYLLNNGHDPNTQDNNGKTAIQLSCLNGHYTVTEILLKHNADPNIPDNNGWTPLMNASQDGHSKLVELLQNITDAVTNNIQLETHSFPTAPKILNLLHDLVHWELVAVHLRGMTDIDIMKIKMSHQNVAIQKFHIFIKWLSMCPDASWDDVVIALEKGKEIALAEKVRAEKSKIMNMVAFPSEDETIEELDELHHSFTMLFQDIQEEIRMNSIEDEDFIPNLVMNIQAAQLDEIYYLKSYKTVEQVIDAFQNNCSFLDGSYLNAIVRFGFTTKYVSEAKKKNLIARTEEHMKRARTFRMTAPIKYLKNRINEKYNEGISEASPLFVKLCQPWDRAKIDHIRKLVKYLSGNEMIAHHIRVVNS